MKITTNIKNKIKIGDAIGTVTTNDHHYVCPYLVGTVPVSTFSLGYWHGYKLVQIAIKVIRYGSVQCLKV